TCTFIVPLPSPSGCSRVAPKGVAVTVRSVGIWLLAEGISLLEQLPQIMISSTVHTLISLCPIVFIDLTFLSIFPAQTTLSTGGADLSRNGKQSTSQNIR